MPAKGNVILQISGDTDNDQPEGVRTPGATSNAATRKEVDHLVKEIKENLKLSSGHGHGGLKMRQSLKSAHKSQRVSPYAVPPSSRVACDTSVAGGNAGGAVSQLRRWNHRRRYPSTCMANGASADQLDDPFQMLQELITDGGLIKEAVRRLQLGLTPKYTPTNKYYDSDDECRTPPAAAFPDLCCEI